MSASSDLAQNVSIAKIVKFYQDSNRTIGRTVLQKVVYLLETVYQVDLGFRFKFYSYGPFSVEVLDKLDANVRFNVLTAETYSVDHGYGTSLKTSANFDQLLELGGDEQSELTQALNKFDQLVLTYDSSKMELASTIIWIATDARRENAKLTQAQFITQAKILKPKYSEPTILAIFDQLNQIDIFAKYIGAALENE